jgi:hypothetical protein
MTTEPSIREDEWLLPRTTGSISAGGSASTKRLQCLHLLAVEVVQLLERHGRADQALRAVAGNLVHGEWAGVSLPETVMLPCNPLESADYPVYAWFGLHLSGLFDPHTP